MATQIRCLGGAACRATGARHGAHQTRQRGTGGQASRFARRTHRSGAVRSHLSSQYAVRTRERARDDVRRLQRRADAAVADAGEHGGSEERIGGCADAVFAAADGVLLFRAVGGESAETTLTAPQPSTVLSNPASPSPSAARAS